MRSDAYSSARHTPVPAQRAMPIPICQRQPVALQWVHVAPQLRAEHGKVRERRVEQPALTLRVALERVAEQRDEHEHQREDREEGVVRDGCGQIPGAFLAVLALHVHHDGDRGMPGLEPCDPVLDPVHGAHGSDHARFAQAPSVQRAVARVIVVPLLQRSREGEWVRAGRGCASG